MATIAITIRTGNAAVQTWDDVANMLVDMGHTILERHEEFTEPRPGDTIPALDLNGGRVGGLVVIEDR